MTYAATAHSGRPPSEDDDEEVDELLASALAQARTVINSLRD